MHFPFHAHEFFQALAAMSFLLHRTRSPSQQGNAEDKAPEGADP